MKVGDVAHEEGFMDGNTAGDDYGYDLNGNMVKDLNKDIVHIGYNHLNLPTQVNKHELEGGNWMHFEYGALGIKMKKTTSDNYNISETEYAGNFIYEDGQLKMSFHPEGYVEPVDADDYSQGFVYVYQYSDIWGNVRLSYKNIGTASSPNLQIQDEKNYYPFGMEHQGYNGNLIGNENNFKTYQGQEFTKDLGLNIHGWKYRISDPAIGRFWQIDPLAEDYYYNSTYAFQENKLGMGVELEGLELSADRSADGKSVTITYRVNPINNTKATDGTYMLSEDDFNTLKKARIKQLSKTLKGKMPDGSTVTQVNVIFDKNATVDWEYNGMIREDGSGDEIDPTGLGKTKEIGNTQDNITQVNIGNHSDLDGNFEYGVTPEVVEEATETGVHEDLKVGGLIHGNEIDDNSLRKSVNSNPQNSMYENGTNIGTKINPQQRQIFVNEIELDTGSIESP